MKQPVPETPMSGRWQPSRAEVDGRPRLRLVDSAAVQALLARIRDRRTGPAEFNRLVGSVASLLIVEACRTVALERINAPGFDGNPIEVQVFGERVAGVAVLRAGLAFADAFRRYIPDAPLYQVGAHRDEATLDASIYTGNVPAQVGWADRVFILDPMLATGGSALAALNIVRRSHVGPVSFVALVAAPLGVWTLLEADADCDIVAAALDERLDENGYIRPGLGDAGDRAFGTLG